MKTQCDVIVVGGGASGLPNGKVDATKKRKNLYLWPGSCESVI